MRLLLRFFLFGIVIFALPSVAQVREPLPVPDLPGFKTLKGDFHMHSVFSDGKVWPTVRVEEAWRDGLDVICISDHADYHPFSRDVKVDADRPYAIAKPVADKLGIILIPGVEITKRLPHGPAHFTALFVKDANALNVPDLHEALRRARTQDAFVFWNHPGWEVPKIEWVPPIAAAYQEKLFQGMELVNGRDFYADAYPFIGDKQLTILANSDQHVPQPPRVAAGIRPITLLFARTRDAAGVHEALSARRTAAWMGDSVWGAEEHLQGLWQGAVKMETTGLRSRPASHFNVQLRNHSSIPFRLVTRRSPDWLRFGEGNLPAEGVLNLNPYLTADAPPGTHRFDVEVEILNIHPGPGRNLIVRLPIVLTIP